MQSRPRFPEAFYPVLKGLLFAADGTVWSVLEDAREERVARLEPGRRTLEEGTTATDVASYELLLMSPN